MLYPDNIPAEQLTRNAHDNMLFFTAGVAILIGIVLFYLGRKGKQQWMTVWSIGLIICSILMAGSLLDY